MTDDMKEKIIKYLTGNLSNESAGSTLTYGDISTISTNLASHLNTTFPNGYDVDGIIQGRNISGNPLNYSVLFGIWTTSSSAERGYVTIIDEVGNVVQTITKFSSGANIGSIYCMNVDEEGYFYMVEENLSNNVKRFVMLNNIVVKMSTDTSYKMTIRKAYAIPIASLMRNALVKKVVKAVGQAKYLIGGIGSPSSGTGVVPIATELTINVGSENTWVDYEGTQWISPSTGYPRIFMNLELYATWDGDVIDIILLTYPQGEGTTVVKYYKDGTGLSYSNIELNLASFSTSWTRDYKILNKNTAYFSFSRKLDSISEEHTIWTLNLANNTASVLYTTGGYYNEDSHNPEYMRFYLSVIDGELLFLDTYCDNSNKCHFEIGRLRDDNYIPSGVYGNISTYEVAVINSSVSSDVLLFYVNRQYNLFNFNVLLNNTNYNTTQVFNANNYNGEPYEDKMCLFPYTGVLYNTNNIPIFARNLYNKVVSGGTTTATIEIPFNFVNGVTIAKQDLLSYNNNIMINNNDEIITNQFEQLYINFLNSILISNENDPNNPIINQTGASRLNNSYSNTTDYSNTLIDKLIIKYQDETTYSKTITKASRLSQFLYNYQFNVYNPSSNPIMEISLASHDNNTIYHTIDFTNMASGKTYKVSQDVEII